MSAAIVYRPARRNELEVAAAVFVRAQEDRERRIGASGGAPPIVQTAADRERLTASALLDLIGLHEESPEWVWIALTGAEIVGVVSLAIRERQWAVHYLFVDPKVQGTGIGRELLKRAHAVGVAAGCDVFCLHSSRDPAALTRYLALGLTPQAPTMVFTAAADRVAFPALRWDDGLDAVPLQADDAATLATVGDIDKVVRGCRRPQDLRRWLAAGETGALLLRRETGAPAGYYLVDAGGAFSVGPGQTGQIGPVAALDEGRFAAVLGRALAAAGAVARPDLRWRVSVPGENRAAVPPLLAAGFRPRQFDAFMSTGPLGLFDRYVLHDSDFL